MTEAPRTTDRVVAEAFPDFFPAGESATSPARADRSISARWTERLAAPFCPVSSFFLRNYHRIGGTWGLNSAEAMLVIHLLDYKWSSDAPYPTTKSLATRMGVTQRQVRATLQKLEGLNLVRRERPTLSSANRFRLEPLFARLESMMDAEEDRKSSTAERQ